MYSTEKIMKTIVPTLMLLLAANAGAASLTWDPVVSTPPIDGYRLYCAPEPVADLGAVTPIFTGTEVTVEINTLIPFDVYHRCWVTAFREELSSGHSNYVVFMMTRSETVTLPTAPSSLTITW